VAQNYKFTGKERDSESGLDNFGARYDASSLGRFMTPDWAAKPISVPYAKFGDPQTLNLYAYVENSPLNRIDADGHDSPGQMCPDCISQSQTESQVSDTNSGAAATTSAQASRANTAQTNLALSWLNVIEVSGSYGWSVGVSGQAGSAEYQATSGVTTEGTIGLGGGNGEVKVSGDVVNGKVKLGDYEGSVKAGVEVSSKDGVTAKAGAEVSAGALKAGVSVDKGGVHTSVGAEKNGDIKLGAHVQGGLGGGLNINFSQAGRAFDQSVQSVNALGQYLMNKFMPSGSIF
jgi:RHS repeat-associated protein